MPVVRPLVLHVNVFPNPQGTCLATRNALPLDLTVELSSIGRGNLRTPPEAGTLSEKAPPSHDANRPGGRTNDCSNEMLGAEVHLVETDCVG